MTQNREYKSSVFVDLFCTDELVGKKNFLELYNAFHGTNLKLEETQMEVKIIPQAIYKTFMNDVGMLINGKLVVLIEHQSTINYNMPLRMLFYVSRIYEGLVPQKNRYYKKLQKIPTPEFYVLYNGKEDYPDEITLKLSDAFYVQNDTPPLELSTKVININVNKNVPIVTTSPTLNEYCRFMEIIREVAADGTEDSYKKAISLAIKQNILKGYLERKATEVINMFLAEYSYEEDISAQREEAFEDGKQQGIQQGISQGIQQGILQGLQQGIQENQIETAKKMLKKDFTVEEISEITGLSLETVEKLI